MDAIQLVKLSDTTWLIRGACIDDIKNVDTFMPGYKLLKAEKATILTVEEEEVISVEYRKE